MLENGAVLRADLVVAADGRLYLDAQQAVEDLLMSV
jgi:hypothetical protein